VAFGIKPLELVAPLVVLPALVLQRVKIPIGLFWLATFLAYVSAHSVIAAALGPDAESIAEMSRFLLSAGMGVLLVTYACAARVGAEAIGKFLLWASVIATPLSIAGFFLPDHPVFGEFAQTVPGKITRITGFDENPNYFVVYLTLCTAIAFSFLTIERRIIYTFLLANIFLAVMLTFSRGAIVVFILQFLVWLTIAFRPNLRMTLTVILFLCIGIWAVLTFDYFLVIVERFAQEQSRPGGEEIRFVIWADIIQIIKAHPVFGIGLLNLKDNLGSVSREFTAHNEYLNMVGSLGLIGGLLFLGFNIDQFRRAYRWYHCRREAVPLATVLFLFGIAAWFMVDTGITSRVYWLGIALFWLYTAQRSRPSPSSSSPTTYRTRKILN